MFGTVILSSRVTSPLFCVRLIQDLTVTHCYIEEGYNPLGCKSYSRNPIWRQFLRLKRSANT